MIDSAKHKEILAVENVNLVGKGKEGQPVIGTSNKVDVQALAWAYPDAQIIYTGIIRALEARQARTDKWRPAPGGVSIGHYAITAGT